MCLAQTTVDRRDVVGGLEPIIEEPEAITLVGLPSRPCGLSPTLAHNVLNVLTRPQRPAVACQERLDSESCPYEEDYPMVDSQHDLEYEYQQNAAVSSGHRKLAAAFVVSADCCMAIPPLWSADVSVLTEHDVRVAPQVLRVARRS